MELTTALQLIALLLAGCSLTLILAAHLCTHWELSKKPRAVGWQPPISVLKPLKGADDELRANLESFVLQEYPDFELVFGAADPGDPALDVARELRDRYPNKKIEIVSGQMHYGFNPKVNNLGNLIRHATKEHVVISDSNVRAERDYLQQLVAAMYPEDLERAKVGLVTNLVAGIGGKTLGAVCENLQLNAYIAAAQCGARVLLRHTCVVGKSMLMRRSDLEVVGGLATVADVLAEDYRLGQLFEQRGFVVTNSSQPVTTVNRDWSLRQFLARHIRWAQMRWRISRIAYFLELALNPLLWLLLASALLLMTHHSRASAALLVSLAALCIKWSADLLLEWRLSGLMPDWRHLVALPLRETSMLFIWLYGAVARQVIWRGNRFTIGPNTQLAPARVRRTKSTPSAIPEDEYGAFVHVSNR